MDKTEIIITNDFDGMRIDKAISIILPDMSRAYIQSILKNKSVFVNDKLILKSYKVNCGDVIDIVKPEIRELSAEAQNIPVEIIYEDDDLLVVNKPKGMVVHPAPGNYDSTLVNALMYHCKGRLSDINGVIRPGIVHRIDKDTSGLLIVAKNNFAHEKLAEQIKAHSFKRQYTAIVYGHIKNSKGIVNAPIGRNPKDRKKMCVTDKNSREAITEYEVLEEYNGFSLVRLTLKTGRTHQIRVHMAYIGHPVAGDAVYGPKNVITSLNGQCLHAGLIGFIHPRDGRYIEFTSDLPEYFYSFMNYCKALK